MVACFVLADQVLTAAVWAIYQSRTAWNRSSGGGLNGALPCGVLRICLPVQKDILFPKSLSLLVPAAIIPFIVPINNPAMHKIPCFL